MNLLADVLDALIPFAPYLVLGLVGLAACVLVVVSADELNGDA